MSGTQLLSEPSSRRHRIQLSFVLFTDNTVFDITLYTSRGKRVFPPTLTTPFFLSYLPTPPLEQDMTQGQFLSGV